MVIKMTKYSSWARFNKDEPRSYYQHWTDDKTFVRGSYSNITGIGVEQIYTLIDEIDIDRSKELLEDAQYYAE